MNSKVNSVTVDGPAFEITPVYVLAVNGFTRVAESDNVVDKSAL